MDHVSLKSIVYPNSQQPMASLFVLRRWTDRQTVKFSQQCFIDSDHTWCCIFPFWLSITNITCCPRNQWAVTQSDLCNQISRSTCQYYRATKCHSMILLLDPAKKLRCIRYRNTVYNLLYSAVNLLTRCIVGLLFSNLRAIYNCTKWQSICGERDHCLSDKTRHEMIQIDIQPAEEFVHTITKVFTYYIFTCNDHSHLLDLLWLIMDYFIKFLSYKNTVAFKEGG